MVLYFSSVLIIDLIICKIKKKQLYMYRMKRSKTSVLPKNVPSAALEVSKLKKCVVGGSGVGRGDDALPLKKV